MQRQRIRYPVLLLADCEYSVDCGDTTFIAPLIGAPDPSVNLIGGVTSLVRSQSGLCPPIMQLILGKEDLNHCWTTWTGTQTFLGEPVLISSNIP